VATDRLHYSSATSPVVVADAATTKATEMSRFCRSFARCVYVALARFNGTPLIRTHCRSGASYVRGVAERKTIHRADHSYGCSESVFPTVMYRSVLESDSVQESDSRNRFVPDCSGVVTARAFVTVLIC